MPLTLRYDPLAPDMLENPYPTYAEMREHRPVLWHEGMRSWVLSRYRDCQTVLRDYDLFARDRRRVGEEIPEFRQNLQALDPPAQLPVRSVFVNSLRAQDVAEVGRRTRDRLRVIFERLARQPEFDFMTEVAGPFALVMTAELLGVEPPGLREYTAISDALAQRMDAGLRPEAIGPGDEARKRLNGLVEDWFAAERRPGTFSELLASAKQEQVPDHYLRNTAATTFNASFGTLYATAGNVVLTLLDRPDALDRLRDDPGLLGTAADELIRFDGPAQATSRVATRPVTIGGVDIEAGQTIVTLMAAANRDPREFDRPEELVLDRKPNRHLGFGWGPHACIGLTFGQLGVRELIAAINECPSRLRLAGKPTRRHTATVRTIGDFPVTFTP
ncbi:cytochrome P450 [Actinokineospora inagensis]|uniref:cytochrome P450 n=1 Tax=Actinokineospora inagensis TaxID=103730 RepID=UPI000419148D|nr:cytochrome P450 [Actinokineospora inagensis]